MYETNFSDHLGVGMFSIIILCIYQTDCNEGNGICTNQQPSQRRGAVLDRLGWVEMAVGLSEVPVTPGTSHTQIIFSPCCSQNNRKRAARSLFERLLFFSLLSSPLDKRQRSS